MMPDLQTFVWHANRDMSVCHDNRDVAVCHDNRDMSVCHDNREHGNCDIWFGVGVQEYRSQDCFKLLDRRAKLSYVAALCFQELQYQFLYFQLVIHSDAGILYFK
jgi:hypothetical protein